MLSKQHVARRPGASPFIGSRAKLRDMSAEKNNSTAPQAGLPSYAEAANPNYKAPSVGPEDSLTEGAANAAAIRMETRFDIMDTFVEAIEGAGKGIKSAAQSVGIGLFGAMAR